MDQDNPFSERSAPADAHDEPAHPAPPGVMLLKPRVVPFGGSKWAKLFAGPEAAPVATRLLEWHEPGQLDADGYMMPDEVETGVESAAEGAGSAFWLPAGGRIALGALLTDHLPGWFAACREIPGLPLTGPRPSTAEAGLLAALALEDQFLPAVAPQSFATLIAAAPLPAHAAPTDDDALALLARLRPPTQPGAPAGLAILPRPGQGFGPFHGQRFTLRNQASVTAWLRARRITVLDPDDTDFAQTATLLNAATLVLIAEPAQAGLLALCQPATRIVELAAEGWAGARTRTLCAALGLSWRLFLGAPPSYPVLAPLAFGAPAPMAYELSISQLNKALSAL